VSFVREKVEMLEKRKEKLTSDTGNELPSKVLDVSHREGSELVLLEEVEDGGSEEFEDEADVIPVIKAFHEMNAFAERRRKKERTRADRSARVVEEEDDATHFSLLGSPFFSSFNTRISILLASLYFWTARMILTA